jgi:class 3 adenylate cyclase
MFEPDVRYCTTKDGIRLAYTVVGEGTPHVLMNEPAVCHQQLAWTHPAVGPLLRVFAEHHTSISFDPRGTGLSDRVLPSATPQWLDDLETVVSHLGLETFDLTGIQFGCRPAIAFTALHPGKVRKLALLDGFARSRDVLNTPPVRAILGALANDWEMATETIATIIYGSGREEGRTHGAYIRECVTQDWYAQQAPTGIDIGALMQQVTVPTMVLRHRASRIFTAEMSRELAASIPGARLVEIDGLWADDPDGMARRIVAFFNDGAPVAPRSHPKPEPPAEPAPLAGTAIILFVDIANSTALTERMGDAAFRAASRALDERLRAAIRDAGGTPVEGKVMGDGVMATFPSAREAIAAAVRCNELSAESELQLHLGIHAGDVIREPGNVYGGAVNIAARICDASAPGEVLVSDVVRGMARTSAGVTFEDRGDRDMKGVGEPVRVYAVIEGGH